MRLASARAGLKRHKEKRGNSVDGGANIKLAQGPRRYKIIKIILDFLNLFNNLINKIEILLTSAKLFVLKDGHWLWPWCNILPYKT